MSNTEKWELRLYTAGQTPKSVAALANLKRVCEEHLAGNYSIEVIDLMKNPRLAKDDEIIAIPTLILAGRLGPDEVVPCLILIPGAIVGYLFSPLLARHLDTRTAKPIILVLSTLAAIAVLARTLT
jgi:hypothetical protein